MPTKISLTPAQKSVVRKMREGKQLNTCGLNFVLSDKDNLKPMEYLNHKDVIRLLDSETINSELTLTTLGRTIEI